MSATPLPIAHCENALSTCPSEKLALIIPTLREAANLRPLIERLRPSMDSLGIPYEIIVVDDDSRDGTDAIMSELSRDDERIRLITRTGVCGLSGAVMHGWRNSKAEVVGVMDSDLQHPPELLPQLWRALQVGADLVVASRYIGQASLHGLNMFRHIVSQIAIWMTWPLQRPGIFVHDPMSGFFLVRRSCIKDLAVQPEGFKVLLEILVRGDIHSVVEVPFNFDRRHGGRSKAGFGVATAYLRLLARLWKLRFTEKYREAADV
jgi:dolichol-phosphate mannosyltransferase